MDSHTIDRAVEASGQDRGIVTAMLGECDAVAAMNENAIIASQQVSFMCCEDKELYAELAAALARDWGVAMGDPTTLLKAFGSVEGVNVKVRYIMEAIKARRATEREAAGLSRRIDDAEYYCDLRVSGNKILGTARDYIARGDKASWDDLVKSYVELCFANDIDVNDMKIKVKCGIDAFKFFMECAPEGAIRGSSSVDGAMFEIDIM